MAQIDFYTFSKSKKVAKIGVHSVGGMPPTPKLILPLIDFDSL